MKIRKLSAVVLAAAAGSTLLLSATAAGAAVAGPRGHASGHQERSRSLGAIADQCHAAKGLHGGDQ